MLHTKRFVHPPRVPAARIAHPLAARRFGSALLRAGGSLLALAAVWCTPSAAHAYRTLADEPRTLSDERITWANPDVDLVIADPEGRITDWEAFNVALQGALDAWSSVRCSMFVPAVIAQSPDRAAPDDGVNTIEIIASGWVERGFGDSRGATTDLRLTRTIAGTWSIAEADLYLNFDTFRWAIEGEPAGGELDLQGVLTHELGHVAGLVHPCGDYGAPSCNGAAEYRESALYPEYIGASQRALAGDDVDGICSLYPARFACDCDEPGACRSTVECARECGCDIQCDGPCECMSDIECPLGLACAVEGESIGSCVDARSFGAPCSAGEDCRSGLCLRRNDELYCTSACRDDASCPGGHTCSPVDGERVCAPVPSQTCSVARGVQTRGGFLIAVMLMTFGTIVGTRRRWRGHILTSVLLSSLALPGCGSSDVDPADDGGSLVLDAAPSELDGGADGGSVHDGGTTDASDIDGSDDAGPEDAGSADIDGDGVFADRDCDDDDSSVGATAERACANACGGGLERCTEGAWAACDAPTDCLCDSPGATQVVDCGNCGQASETCTDGRWLRGACLFEGECSPGTTETQPATDPYCREVVRLCQSSCSWSEWTPVGPQGECRRLSSACTGTPEAWWCNELCMRVEHPTPACRGGS